MVLEETIEHERKRRLARSRKARVLDLIVGSSLVLGACSPRRRRAAPAQPAGRVRGGGRLADRAPAITAPPSPDRPRARTAASSSAGSSAWARAVSPSSSSRAEFVDAYNKSQKDVYIALEIYNNNVAANILKTQIAAGNAPDLIGPVGVEGLNLFRDQLLDLQPLIDKTGYNVDGVDPELVDFFKLGEGNATIGVPFATYPSFLYFNKDLFDEAGLPYPPTKVGDKYQGKDWDMAAVRELAMKLTVDKNGNDATSADFDADERRPVGLRHAVRRQQPAGRGVAVRRQLVPRRRRQVRPDPGPGLRPARSGSTTASGRTTSSRARTRSTATCSTRATSSSRATWR